MEGAGRMSLGGRRGLRIDVARVSARAADAWRWHRLFFFSAATAPRDASQYLVITVRNKLVYSQYIQRSPGRGNPVLTASSFEGPAKIHSQSSSPSDCLLCPTLLFFDSAIMTLGINRGGERFVACLRVEKNEKGGCVCVCKGWGG